MAESTPQNVLVRRLCVETADVRSLELVAADGRPLQAFEAGAHIDVHLGDGLIRQYSLINTTGTDGSYRIAVKLEPNSRGGSARMHRLAEGNALTVSLPRNNFPLDSEAGHTMLLAGGIGITPLLGMAYRLMEEGASFPSITLRGRGKPSHSAKRSAVGHLPRAADFTSVLTVKGRAPNSPAGWIQRHRVRIFTPAVRHPSCKRFAISSPQSQGRSCIWSTSPPIPCWLPSRPVHSG